MILLKKFAVTTKITKPLCFYSSVKMEIYLEKNYFKNQLLMQFFGRVYIKANEM